MFFGLCIGSRAAEFGCLQPLLFPAKRGRVGIQFKKGFLRHFKVYFMCLPPDLKNIELLEKR